MAYNLPSRWYRSLSDKTDIADFVEHLNLLRLLSIKDREYPAQIRIYGEAYYLLRVIYISEQNRLKTKFLTLLSGYKHPLLEIAKSLGGMFIDYIKDINNPTAENCKLIFTFYMLMTDDDGSSAIINYCDAFSIDNPYWEPKELY